MRFRKPGSRHLQSNKSGSANRRYRVPQYARAGDMKRLGTLLFRPLKSQDQVEAERRDRERAEAGSGD